MSDIETIEAFDGKKPFPGSNSMFLAMLNSRMEDASPGERKEYLAIRYDTNDFLCKEEAVGKEAANGKNVAVTTNSCEYECSFVHRKTRSDAKSGTYSHEIVLKIEHEKKLGNMVPKTRNHDEFEIC